MDTSDWHRFVDEVVTPRFPAGFTVVHADGQWRDPSGAVTREPAEVMTLMHAGDEGARASVAAVVASYKTRFGQEAVLRERVATCASF